MLKTVWSRLISSEAFDRINHSYMMKIVQRLIVPKFATDMIRLMYRKTRPFIELHGFLCEPTMIERGFRRSCPLNVLLFKAGLEYLSRQTPLAGETLSLHEQTISTSAGDLTVELKTTSLSKLFKDIRGLGKNKRKKEIT